MLGFMIKVVFVVVKTYNAEEHNDNFEMNKCFSKVSNLIQFTLIFLLKNILISKLSCFSSVSIHLKINVILCLL